MIPCVGADKANRILQKMADPANTSMQENANAPMLGRASIDFFNDLLFDGVELKETDLLMNPGNATPEQVAGLPPAVFGICGLDPLRDEGLLYAKMLCEAG